MDIRVTCCLSQATKTQLGERQTEDVRRRSWILHTPPGERRSVGVHGPLGRRTPSGSHMSGRFFEGWCGWKLGGTASNPPGKMILVHIPQCKEILKVFWVSQAF